MVEARLSPADALRTGMVSWAFWLMALTSLGLFVWVLMRPEVLLVGFPLFLVAAPLAFALMLVYFRQRTVGTGIWILPLVLLAVDFNLRPGAAGPTAGLDAQSIAKAVVYGIAILHGLVAMHRNPVPRGLAFVFIAYALIGLMSATYADPWHLAAGGGLALLGIGLAANTVSTMESRDIARMWSAAFWVLTALAVASLILYVFLPGFAISSRAAGGGRLQGLTGAPNSLGPLMVIGLLVAGSRFLEARSGLRRAVILGAGACMVIALLLTQSRTAMLGLLVAVGIVIAARYAFALWAVAIGALAATWIVLQPSLLQALLSLSADLFARSGQVVELTTFTGRIAIWQFSLGEWADAPLLGYGLGGARRVISEGWAFQWGGTTGSAHNALLESLLSVGLVGTVLLVVFVVALLVQLTRAFRRAAAGSEDRRMMGLLLALTVFVVVGGLMEKSFAGLPSPQVVALAMALGCYLSYRQKPPSEVDRK